jgi:hypothetical protein
MPKPTQQDVHIDSILTNISIGYMNAEKNYVASQVFPMIPVSKQSDKYFTYTKGDWFKDEAQVRADSMESEGSGYGLSTDNYSAKVYAFHKDIGDQTRKNADNPINLDEDAVRFVTQRLLIRREIQFASDFFKTGVWSTDKVGGTDFTQWSDFTASDPIEDVENGKEAILSVTGYMPNTLLLGYQVFRKLRNHPDIIDRIKYTSSDVVTEQLLAKYFEVDKVLVARSIKNTGKEGQTDSFAFNFGKSALLCYANPSPGLLAPSAGYCFQWTGVNEVMNETVGVSRFRMDLKRSDRIEGQMAFTNKVVGTDLGYFFGTAVA